MIKQELYGIFSDGRQVTKYTIQNSKGEYVELLDFGATIHGIYVRDRNGCLDNVVLSVKTAEELRGSCRAGSTIGRCANRIAFGRYEIDGKTVQLETNYGPHTLHSASGNYAKQFFEGKVREKENAVFFHLRDRGTGGFDCAVDVTVGFSFDEDSRLTILYDMIPEKTTLLCPTNHAYFNLNGSKDLDARKQQLTIRANKERGV